MKINERIHVAQQIRPYVASDWLVEWVGDPLDAKDVAALNKEPYQVIDRRLYGWGRYTSIIRVPGPDDRAVPTYYLAILVE